VLASRLILFIALAMFGACVTPRAPVAPHPPAPDRYALAADPDPAVRRRAADELIYDPTAQAVQMLLTLHQRDVDPSVRAHAAAAIAERRDPSLDAVLEVSAQRDPDPSVRAAAALAYERLWPWRKRPGVAAGLALIPGAGHFYLRNGAEGVAYLGTFTALVVGGVAAASGGSVTLDGMATEPGQPVGLVALIAAQNLWTYSIFDAYRDARVLRGDQGYKHSITRENIGELASAPFRPSVLASPWVWGGVPLTLGAGVLFTYIVTPDAFDEPSIFDVKEVNFLGRRMSPGKGYAAGLGYFATLFVPVGVGEEALFRGLIQTELDERFGTWGGLALSSIIFGGVHVLNFAQDPATAAKAVPFITIVGSALGLAYIANDYKLSTGVAMHFWYDFLLSASAFAIDPQHQPFVVQWASPW